MAMLIQILSAKLGIATGKNTAEQIRDHYPRPVVWFYWVQAEIIAMATDPQNLLVRRSVLNSFWVFRCCRARC